MLIEVDNLDEVIKTMLEDKRPLLIAEIERAVNGFGQNMNAMLKNIPLINTYLLYRINIFRRKWIRNLIF